MRASKPAPFANPRATVPLPLRCRRETPTG
jgi:hypothetical protein